MDHRMFLRGDSWRVKCAVGQARPSKRESKHDRGSLLHGHEELTGFGSNNTWSGLNCYM
jgi:hypothetical protein